MDVLGIDVGKRDLHASLLQGPKASSKSVPNSPAGIDQLQTWLKNRGADQVHACMEATGGWSEEVAIVLAQAGHIVSLVNPSRIARAPGVPHRCDVVSELRVETAVNRIVDADIRAL